MVYLTRARWEQFIKPTLASLLLASVAHPALAQDSNKAEDLGTIVVTSTEDATGPVDGDVNPLTVTGSKSPMLITEVPQSVSILGRHELSLFEASTVSEGMRYTAGVTADVYGNDTDYDWLRVRGFQADQTGIYLDNAQNLSHAFGSFYTDPYILERAEVLRGPSSALYGGSNPGGIINYVSKRAGGHIGEVTVGINDAGRAWFRFDYGEDLNADSSFRVTGRLEGGEKYDDLNEGWRGTVHGSLKHRLESGTEITLLANVHSADEKHNGSTFLPYYGTVKPTSQFGYIDPDANFSDPDWDSYQREQATASLIVEHEFDNAFTLTGIGRVGRVKLQESYYYPYGYSGYATQPVDAQGTLALIAFEHETEVKTAQSDIRYYGKVDTGAIEHSLLFGVDARHYWLDEVQSSGYGTNTVVGTTAPGAATLGAPYQDAVTTQNQLGLYVQDQMRWGNWLATFNLRHDWVDTEQDGAKAFQRNDSEISYRVALAHEMANGITPYVSMSSFFNPLITAPADGVTKPETGEQYEVGVKWAPEGGNFSLTGSAFQINRQNVVTGSWFTGYNQLGEVRMRGLELEGKYNFGNGLSLTGAATLLDAKIMKDSDASLLGLTPTLIPDYELNLLAEYSFSSAGLDGLTLGAGVRHRGKSMANAANTLEVDPSTIFDGYAKYAFDNGAKASLSVTNIADTRYVTACQTEYVCSYGGGREISLSLSKDF